MNDGKGRNNTTTSFIGSDHSGDDKLKYQKNNLRQILEENIPVPISIRCQYRIAVMFYILNKWRYCKLSVNDPIIDYKLT